MKTFEVIYDTAEMRNMRYAFGADSIEEAYDKVSKLVTGTIKLVIEVTDLGHPIITDFDQIEKVLYPGEITELVKDIFL